MNCQCVPPKLAVVKVSRRPNSEGKEFFTCPTGDCKLFSWVGDHIPMSMAFGKNRQTNVVKRGTSYTKHRDHSPQKVNGKHEVKVLIYEITQPPAEIWLSLQCPSTPAVNDLFARLPQDKCKFSNTLKMWLFSFSLYERIIQEFLTPPFESMHLPELPRFLAKGLASYQKKVNKIYTGPEPELNLPPRILSTLLPFQLEAVKFVVRRGGRALLGDDMGCGKTFQAIACMMHYRAHWPVLIVVPSSLLKQWPDEIQKYAGDRVKPSDVCIVGKSSDIKTGLITIITYKVMDNLVGSKQLSPDQFGVVIADESHNLKNKDTSRSGAVLPFLKKATVALCMSGTPAVNRPVELFSQLNGLLPEVFSDYNQFVTRYCDAKPHRNMPGLNVSGSSNEAELNILLNALVMIRRTKADVLSSLPEKRRELRYVDPDPECLPEIRRINARSKKLDEQLANPVGRDAAEIQAMTNEKQQLLTALYTVTGTSKIPAIREELVKMIEESRRERGIEVEAAVAASARKAGGASVKAGAEDLDSDATAALDSGEEEGKAGAHRRPHKKPGPVIMDLEEDIVTGACNPAAEQKRAYVMDLCDSDSDGDRKKATSGTGKGKEGERKRPRDGQPAKEQRLGGFWAEDEGGTAGSISNDSTSGYSSSSDASEGEEGCDFNISDIKAGVDRRRKVGGQRMRDSRTAKETERGSEAQAVYSLFERIGASRKRKATASDTSKRPAKAQSGAAAVGSSSAGSSADNLASAEAAKSVGQKIIVFFHHKTVLSAIEDSLTEMQVKFIKIDGATPQGKRAKLIDQFQNDDVTDVALLSITACGVGLNLTRANVALFGELNWSLGVVLQAEDRIHRLGQLAKTVRIIYMIARNTVDEIVWEQIQRKHQVVGATVGTSETRSYGGGMRISAYREDGASSSAGSGGSGAGSSVVADQEAVLAGFGAYANKNAARTPLPGPCSEPKVAHPQPEVSGPPVAGSSMTTAPAARPLPACYQAAAIAGRQPTASFGGPGTGPAPAPPVARQLFVHGAAPGSNPLPSAGPVSAICARPEEFSYSASTQATDGILDAMLDSNTRGNCGAGNPFAPSFSHHLVASINDVPSAPIGGGGNPFPPAPAPQQAVPTLPTVLPVPPAPQQSAPSTAQPASKTALPPEVLARIEANRQAAQARLAAAKLRNEQQAAAAAGGAVPPSLATAWTYPQHNAPAPSMLGVPSVQPVGVSPAVAVAVDSRSVAMGSPSAGAALISRAPSINEPPLAIRPSPFKSAAATALTSAAPAASHVFSTGRGGAVNVTEEQVQRAGMLLGGPPPVHHHASAAPVVSATTGPPVPSAVSNSPAAGGSATLFFDGGALGNPGKGGAGYQLFADNGRTIKESSVRLVGQCTNNQAEYVGLVHGFTAALHSGVQDLAVYGNSEVVIKQMTGQYQVKNPVLMDLHQRADVLRQQFRRVALQWIPKDKNGGADRLSKRALHQPEAANEAADWFRV